MACETATTTGVVVVAGEITYGSHVKINVPDIVRQTVKEIGYTDAAMGLDYKTCAVMVALGQQRADIAMGLDRHGAGGRGRSFG